MAFIDVHKVSNSLEIWCLLESLDNAKIDSRYIQMIRYIYENNIRKRNRIQLNRGVRLEDSISSKLSTLALQTVVKNINLEKLGIIINGLYLTHTRFADDKVLRATNINKLQETKHQTQ